MAQPPRKTELNFQPITDGLGFHPFSDGLPYAPIAKTQTQKTPQTGTGATAAGAPTFATSAPRMQAPRMQAPRVSVPVARTTVQAQQPQIQAKPQPQIQQQVQATYGIGYSIKRVLAYTLDTAFNLALCVGALSVAMWKQNLNPELLLSPGIVLVSTLFLIVFNWALTTAQEVAFGTSVGKRIFGLALDGSTTAVFLRAFFFLPSLGFGGLGILWALFDRRKRCWHDLVVDLQPTQIARL